jgi:formate-dependent nitrite reductase cytochrome c552 subunit
MLADFPDSAQLTNIQCENCHGPNNGGAHTTGASRVSLSSDVCAVCHGEPLRHARFQQWQLSGHANYELAIDESESGSCSPCHTANGFLAWLPVLLDDDPDTDPLAGVDVTWTADEAHPQTCVACHDPHSIGTTTGVETDATVRINGDTPPLVAGFQVFGAGKGAICMTCHNSRRGLRNESTYEETAAAGDAARAPHGSAQTDVLMGQNAYLVNTGIRGSHSLVKDTCVECHMDRTPPPDLLAYNQGGTNHTFFASDAICANCHEEVEAHSVEEAFEASSEELQTLIEDALLQLIADLTEAGNTIDLAGEATITEASQVSDIEFGESSGRQAVTITLPDGVIYGPFRMNDVGVLDGTGVALGELYDFADERLIKAGWNWNLTNNDGSKGIHNPPFVFEALDAAIDALIVLAAE